MNAPSRKRLRMEGFDYSTPGQYFITINTHTRAPWFGRVHDGVLHPNGAGTMVERIWNNLPDRFPGIMMDTVVVMPDHLHGILVLGTDSTISLEPTLSDVVGVLKSLTTREYGRGVTEAGWSPFDRHLWHRSFRDTIVRSEQSLNQFRGYIEGNPARWSEKHGN
jgi:putative transposase